MPECAARRGRPRPRIGASFALPNPWMSRPRGLLRRTLARVSLVLFVVLRLACLLVVYPPSWPIALLPATPIRDAHRTRPDLMPTHAYPRDLALLVRERWAEVAVSDADGVGEADETAVLLPDPAVLERLLSACYQASLLHEEGRPVTFRIALARPEAFKAAGGPPTGLHRLVLNPSRPFDEHELRRLAPAAVFQRSLAPLRRSRSS